MEKEAIGNQRKLWMRVKEDKRSTRGGTHINDKYGQLLTDQMEVMDRWKEHFESLFQEVEDAEQPDLEMGQESDKEISEEALRRAVSRLKGPWKSTRYVWHHARNVEGGRRSGY